MNTIYWITRFDAVNIASWVLFALSLAIFFVGFSIYMDNREYNDEDPEKCVGKAIMKICTVVSTITLMLIIFIPTSNEAIAIYGGGKILEYVESNEKLQNMPDKIVTLTDEYIDTLNRKLNDVENKEGQ